MSPDQPPAQDRYVPLAKVAAELGLEKTTLYGWRKRGYGPESIKFGGLVVYKRSVLDAWRTEQEELTSSRRAS